jgi:hypothetical protein
MKKLSVIIIAILIVVGISSCRIFRKKNKCDTCPSWKSEIEQAEENVAKV